MLPERRPATVKFLNFECHWHSKNCFSCGSLWREFVWWLDMVESGSTWNCITTGESPLENFQRILETTIQRHNGHWMAPTSMSRHRWPYFTRRSPASLSPANERTRMGRLKWFSRVLANIRQFKRECSSHRPILNGLFVHLLCAPTSRLSANKSDDAKAWEVLTENVSTLRLGEVSDVSDHFKFPPYKLASNNSLAKN